MHKLFVELGEIVNKTSILKKPILTTSGIKWIFEYD